MTTQERFDQERRHVGDGWQPIIERCHTRLTELLGEYDLLQIKEKFGGLRYYIGGALTEEWREAQQIIEEAEEEAAGTCEECGLTGETVKNRSVVGWYRTLCLWHHESAVERRLSQ